MIETILVFDVGTSSVKIALFSFDGKLISSVNTPYPTTYTSQGWAEQEILSFWNATIEGTRKLIVATDSLSYSIAIISISGHMNGMVAVDDSGWPTYPEIIHCDTRSIKEVAFIKNIYSQNDIYSITGNRIDEYLSLPKLLWLKNNEEDAFKKTRFVINAKDYIQSRLKGVIGRTEKESATLLHLQDGIPVCFGAGDAAMATRGAHIKDSSRAYASLGSSAWISTLHMEQVHDDTMRMQHFYDLYGNNINICKTVQSAGAALEWAKRMFFSDKEYESIEKELQSISYASILITLPFFMGERTPHFNPFAQTSFMGASISTTPLEMALSLYEGVAFALYEIMEVYDELNIPINSFYLLGGGVKSRFWCEMIASVCNIPLHIHPHYQNGTSYGAALCAMVGSGYYPSLEEAIRKTPLVSERIEPNKIKHNMYKKYFSLYKKMYHALKPLFSELYSIQKSFEENQS